MFTANKIIKKEKDNKKRLVQSELFSSKINSSSGIFDVLGYTGGSKNKNHPIINAPPKIANIYNAPVLGAGVSNINFGNQDVSKHFSNSFNKTANIRIGNELNSSGENKSKKKRPLNVAFSEKERNDLVIKWKELINDKGFSANAAVDEINKERLKNNERTVSRDSLYTWYTICYVL